MGSTFSSFTKGGIAGLPADPLTRKINESLGLVQKEEKPAPAPVVQERAPSGPTDEQLNAKRRAEQARNRRRAAVIFEEPEVRTGASLLS